MPFYQGGGRHARPSTAYSRPDKVPMGLLADELWPTPQYVADRDPSGRRRSASRGEQTEAKVADTGVDDEPLGLPSSVVNLYRENLDEDGQAYLARGPRSFEEQLAYAQQVRPDAHTRSGRASTEDQLRFRQWRDVDWAQNFVGPDGIVYARDQMGEERPEARILRAYEKMVGGFKRPKLDNLLAEFDLPDPLEGLSPETRAKVSEHEPPVSADEAAWRAWARKQQVNPDTWFMGERRPEWDQSGYWFSDGRDLPPVWGTSLFVGPDGFVYRQNDLTRPDRATEVSAALEDLWAAEALRDAPPEEVYDRALASGAWAPGGNFGRGYYGGASAPWGRTTWRTPSVKEIQPVPKRSGGRRGDAGTRDDLEQQVQQVLKLNPQSKHTFGSRKKGRELREEYVPNPARELLGDGRWKAIWPDATLALRNYILRLQHATMTRSGKPTLDEDATAMQLFLRTHSNGYTGMPQSNVYVLTKRNQLQRLLDEYRKRNRMRSDDEEVDR